MTIHLTPIGTGQLYATVAQLKSMLGVTSATDDVRMGEVLAAICRQIDRRCGRFFYQTVAGQVNYYTPDFEDALDIDDVVTVTEIAQDISLDHTYSRVWVATDYDLEPYNAPYEPEPEPYTSIHIRQTAGNVFFANQPRSIRITGTWGWPAVPDVVREATLLQAARLFKRREVLFGVVNWGIGSVVKIQQSSLDPDILELIPPALYKTAPRATVSWNLMDRKY